MRQYSNNHRKSGLAALLGSTSTAVLILATISLAAVTDAAAENIDSHITVNLPRTISGDLYVGFSGNGTLDITNGGRVVVNVGNDSFLGSWLGRTGTVLVTGSDASWINNRELYVGYMGRGEMIISDGGTVTDTGGYIGHQPNSSGKVTVTGIGSTWSSA